MSNPVYASNDIEAMNKCVKALDAVSPVDAVRVIEFLSVRYHHKAVAEARAHASGELVGAVVAAGGQITNGAATPADEDWGDPATTPSQLSS